MKDYFIRLIFALATSLIIFVLTYIFKFDLFNSKHSINNFVFLLLGIAGGWFFYKLKMK